MTVPLFVVDAFTDQPFAGNPAAVCLLPTMREPEWMRPWLWPEWGVI